MKFRYTLLVVLACALVGCASRPHGPVTDSQTSWVREIRFVGTPEYPELAEKARAVGNEFYSQVWASLNDVSVEPLQFDIIFREDLARQRSRIKRSTASMPKMTHSAGVAVGGNVYLNTETVLKEPEALEFILLHEMAHLAQRYSWYRRVTMPHYWQEGIAEAMVFKLENVNIPKGRPCKCSALWPRYTSGYSCAAAFLLYLEKVYDPQLVSRLNSAIRDGSYSDFFFYEAIGRDLDQLWSEFLRTSSITPMAAKINQIYGELGYGNGKLPRDAKARLKAYLAEQPNGEEVIRLLDWAGDIQALVTRSAYFVGAGGSIIEAMNLEMQNLLPGMAVGDDVTIWAALSMFEIEFQEHASPHEIRARKEGDSSTYHYQFVRASENGAWTLEKAWRTDERGAVLENYLMNHN